jgi:NosR/NirI family nitrous oxide reductase transcriptional regulator
VIGVDAISGATVTVIAQNQVMMPPAPVARQVGILEPTVREPARYAVASLRLGPAGAEGAVQRLLVKPEQVGLERDPEPFIELWFGDLNHPDLGQPAGQGRLRGLPAPQGRRARHLHHQARRQESFKGSGFVRGGIYDRVQVARGGLVHLPRPGLRSTCMAWRPRRAALHRVGIFIIRSRRSRPPTPGSWSSWATSRRATGTAASPTSTAYWLPAAC